MTWQEETKYILENELEKNLKNNIKITLTRLAQGDCLDNSCYFAKNKNGMRTNGGCRCIDNIVPEIISLCESHFMKTVEWR